MLSKAFESTALGLILTAAGWSQAPAADQESVPIYRVMVVERTVKAVSYQYRNGPTPVDFRGTVLLPKAKGTAAVESKAGRIEIDARFEHVAPPTRFGREYLTYVLWAITPEGHAKNLGEILANGSDRASLHVTTDLQAFGMIVTAEPYSAVRRPSDVVVMENEIRPDTIGHVEQISAKYELLPRGQYTYQVPADLKAVDQGGPSLSMSDYEKTVELYQAQNAVQIARSAGADKYAPETFTQAEQFLREAQRLQSVKADKSLVVTAARHAAQTAEDARAIADKRQHDEELTLAQQRVSEERQRRAQAEAEAQRAKAEASADRAQLEAERKERLAAAVPGTVREDLPQPPAGGQTVAAAPLSSPAAAPGNDLAAKKEVRSRMLRDLAAAMDTRDAPSGLVVTVPNGEFHGTDVNPAAGNSLARIAAAIVAHPGLRVQVDGHTDHSGSPAREEEISYQRAAAVRDALIRNGVPAGSISARGLGGSRPLVSNASPAGRQQNQRVEITISGDPIGTLPYWDRTYSLAQ